MSQLKQNQMLQLDPLSLLLFNQEVFCLIKLIEYAKALALKNIVYQLIKIKYSIKSNKFKIILLIQNSCMLWHKKI
jgi:hypothetical protein